MAPRRIARAAERSTGFVACAPELAYCTDCRGNRAAGDCPRLRRAAQTRRAASAPQGDENPGGASHPGRGRE